MMEVEDKTYLQALYEKIAETERTKEQAQEGLARTELLLVLLARVESMKERR